MNPGDLRHRGKIQTRTSSPTGDAWTDVRDQWAKIEPLGSSKIAFLSAQGSKVTHMITFREKPAVNIGEGFLYAGRNYRIISVQIFDDRQEALAELIQ